jgi:hypothetical protein
VIYSIHNNQGRNIQLEWALNKFKIFTKDHREGINILFSNEARIKLKPLFLKAFKDTIHT